MSEPTAAERLLAEAICAALHPGAGYAGGHVTQAVEVLAASPQLAEVMTLGLAWKAAEAALPEGETSLTVSLHRGCTPTRCSAHLAQFRHVSDLDHTMSFSRYASGATPAEALDALAALLRTAK